MSSNQKNPIIQKLIENYPDASCSLRYKTPHELLIATILSAQCTDERVNKVTVDLFAKYKTIAEFAHTSEEDLQEDIHSTGFFRNKARNIIGTCRKILTDYGGEVPKTMKELTSLPGVARKTGNVVLGNAFNIADGIVVDTHVTRLSQRFRWTQAKGADKIELDLMKLVPKEEWIHISHRLILHGRKYCQARKANCTDCFLNTLCPSAFKL